MSVSGNSAVPAVPYQWNIGLAVTPATGTINVGDWLQYSGQQVLPGFSGQASTAYWKTSGAGVALESNPVYDPAGRTILNTAMKIMVEGVFWATAAFSGEPTLGLGAYPVSTGSGAYSPTGKSGLAATWQTAAPLNHSGLSGTATPQAAPVATVIGSRNFVNAGTGELLLRLMALPPDVRG